MTNHAKSLTAPILIITLGVGWLLTVHNVLPGVNWVWILGLAVTGVLILVVGGVNKVTFVIGPLLIASTFFSLLRQTGRISIDTEVPSLVIAFGTLMLLAKLLPLRSPRLDHRGQAAEVLNSGGGNLAPTIAISEGLPVYCGKRPPTGCPLQHRAEITMTTPSDATTRPEEPHKRGRFRSSALFGFLLSLPTLAGWILAVVSWSGPIQAFLLAAGSLAGTAGLLLCLNVCLRRPGRKRLAVCGLVLGMVSLVDLVVLLLVVTRDVLDKSARPEVPFTISKSTTYITAPLGPDGFPDYLAFVNERYGKGVTPENNAAVLAWRAVGPKEVKEPLRPEFFRLLGTEPLPADGKYFVAWPDYTKELVEKELSDRSAKRTTYNQRAREQELMAQFQRAAIAPWSAASLPAVAQWLKQNDAPLALLVAASKRPRYFSPLVAADEPRLLGANNVLAYYQIRGSADTLCRRAMLRLKEGKTADARDDLLAACRLARLLAQQPSDRQWLNARTLDRYAATGLLALFHFGPKNIEDARSLDRQVQQMADLPDPAKFFDVETRLLYLDFFVTTVRQAQRTRNPLDVLVSRALVDPVLTDWDGAMALGNARCDRIDQLAKESDWARQAKAARSIEDDWALLGKDKGDRPRLGQVLRSPRGAYGRFYSEKLLSMVFPLLPHILRLRNQNTTRLQLLRLASTINVYRAEHGAYPKTLTDLTPKYLATLPVDFYHGNPFRYRAQGDGYILYSVGPNGKDDGGRTGGKCPAQPARQEPWDDVGITVPPTRAPLNPLAAVCRVPLALPVPPPAPGPSVSVTGPVTILPHEACAACDPLQPPRNRSNSSRSRAFSSFSRAASSCGGPALAMDQSSGLPWAASSGTRSAQVRGRARFHRR